jgi:hypothetical protein
MVDLMENTPKKIDVVAGAVPPIKYEGSNEPPYKALNKRWYGMSDVKEGPLVHPTIPCDASEKNDSHLTAIQECRARVPARDFRQLAAG